MHHDRASVRAPPPQYSYRFTVTTRSSSTAASSSVTRREIATRGIAPQDPVQCSRDPSLTSRSACPVGPSRSHEGRNWHPGAGAAHEGIRVERGIEDGVHVRPGGLHHRSALLSTTDIVSSCIARIQVQQCWSARRRLEPDHGLPEECNIGEKQRGAAATLLHAIRCSLQWRRHSPGHQGRQVQCTPIAGRRRRQDGPYRHRGTKRRP